MVLPIMGYFIGQKIVFLHEEGGGVVISIEANGRIKIEDEDGFSRICLKSEIAPVFGEHEINDFVIEESDLLNHSSRSKKNKDHFERWEIDLHIEELVDSHYGWTNGQILDHQMRCFRQFLSKARSNKVRRVVAIHGVGEGVLRHELREWLKRQSDLEFLDADYREYGQGATQVNLYYH